MGGSSLSHALPDSADDLHEPIFLPSLPPLHLLRAAAMTLRTVLLSIQALLQAAEPDDPQDAVVARYALSLSLSGVWSGVLQTHRCVLTSLRHIGVCYCPSDPSVCANVLETHRCVLMSFRHIGVC